MTRRSMNNERSKIGGDREPVGVTKKSASSAKPKMEAASTIYTTQKKQKTSRQMKREADEKKRKKEAKLKAEAAAGRRIVKDLEKSPEEKKWQKIWWGSLIAVCVTFAIAFLVGTNNTLFIIALVIAYAEVVFSFWVQFAKLQKFQKARINPELYRKVSKKERAHKLAEQDEKEAQKKAKQDAFRAKFGLKPKDETKSKAVKKNKTKSGQFK